MNTTTAQVLADLDLSRLPDGYMDEVLAFAERRGLLCQIMEQLAYLAETERWQGTRRVQLYKDFAPYSFTFQEYINDKPAIYGGLIYYGPGDTGVSGPQFSVRIGDTREGWRVNT